MKLILIAALMGVTVWLITSSCVTAPKSLAPGELRLLSMQAPENKIIKTNIPFEVNLSFEAAGEPEVKGAVFTSMMMAHTVSK